MKNKIFELYKPKSLADFLEFKKENPKENFVYVLQHPPANINILGASDFGYLVICLPNFGPDSQIVFSSSPFVFQMGKNLQDVREQAYVARKSTRLNSSPANISYAVFCLKKKKKYTIRNIDERTRRRKQKRRRL